MNKDFLRQLCHFIGGLITIALAFLYFELTLFGKMNLYIVLGSLFIVVAALSQWLERKLGKLSLLFFVIEAIVFYCASGIEWEEDDAIVRAVILLAAFLYLVLAVFFFLVPDKDTSQNRRRIRRRTGSPV